LLDELLLCSPLAVGLAKRVIDGAAKPALAASLEHEVAVQQICAQSEDFAEGARAFAERRQPEFSGR
jgi:enoyl-CoA hydratase/carnithine racemase